MASYTQANRPLAVTTPLGPDVLLLEKFSGAEAISEPYHFQLDMLCPNREPISYGNLLGKRVTVELRTNEGGNKRYFNGIINRLSQGSKAAGQDKDTFIKYQAEMVPELWLLSRNRNNRIFQTVSVPDILKEILKNQWSLDVSFQLQGDFLPRDYCVQYEESDLNFVSRLMEEEGIFYFFVHREDGHQMVVANHPRTHPDLNVVASVPFEDEAGGASDTNRVTQWIKTQEIRSPKFTLWDHSFELPASHLDAQENVLGKMVAVGTIQHPLQVGGNQRLELYDFPGGYAQRFDGVGPGGGDRAADIQNIFSDNTRTCKIRMEQETAQALAIEGGGHCWQFSSGSMFNFKGHFDADGQYVLTRVTHTADMGGAYTSGTSEASMTYHNTFTCIPLALPYRPRQKTPKPQIVGPQTAEVVGTKGEEIFCDKYGRVKVQFHWDRLGTNDANSSCWVRVSQISAGGAWGACFLPRVGHEVIVGFIGGDPDQPIILGNVYNAALMPPFKLPEESTRSGFKSNSFNRDSAEEFSGIAIEDKKDQEHVQVHSEKDLTLWAQHNKQVNVGNTYRTNVENAYVRRVGGFPGLGSGGGGGGSGAGGGTSDKHQTNFKWGDTAEPTLGMALALTVGSNHACTTGFFGNYTLGQNTTITVSPFSPIVKQLFGESPLWALWFSKQVGGLSTVTYGANTTLTYGPNISVHHGGTISIDCTPSKKTKLWYRILGVTHALTDLAYDSVAGAHEYALFGPAALGGGLSSGLAWLLAKSEIADYVEQQAEEVKKRNGEFTELCRQLLRSGHGTSLSTIAAKSYRDTLNATSNNCRSALSGSKDKMDKLTNQITQIEGMFKAGAGNIELIARGTPKAPNGQPANIGCIHINAQGNSAAGPNGALFLNGSNGVSITSGDGKVLVLDDTQKGKVSIQSGDMGTICLERGKTRTKIQMDHSGIVIDGGLLPVTIKSTAGIKLAVGDSSIEIKRQGVIIKGLQIQEIANVKHSVETLISDMKTQIAKIKKSVVQFQ